jgi:hypothetical protein
MKTRLALVAAKVSMEGPWLRARGNETGVRIQFLGEGERIVMFVCEQGVIRRATAFEQNGTFDLPPVWDSIRFDKIAGESANPTQVELLVA